MMKTPRMDRKEIIESDGYNPLHVLYRYHHKELNNLKRQGIFRKLGKWDSSEINQIEKNMQDYLEENHVKDFSRLIYPQTKEERAFRKKTLFFTKMCKGLQRTRDTIRTKVECYFSTFLHKGRYSNEEKAEMLKLYKINGHQQKKWKRIATVMNRSHHGMGNIYSELISSHERWTGKEDKVLIETVNDFIKKGEKISWKVVAHNVGTRGGAWCRERWYRKLRNLDKNNPSESVDFSDRDVYQMIKIIYEANVDDHYLIDWVELSDHFDNSISPNWLKWKFGVICKEIQNSHSLEFEELIDQLFKKYSKKLTEDECNNEITSMNKNNCCKDVIIIEQISETFIDNDARKNDVFNDIIIIDD